MRLKIQFKRKIVRFFHSQRIQNATKERRLPCLPRREDDDVASLFNPPNEIGEFFRARNDVVLLCIHRTSSAESPSLSVFHIAFLLYFRR